MAVDGPPNRSVLQSVNGQVIDTYAKAVAALAAALAYFEARKGQKQDDNAS